MLNPLGLLMNSEPPEDVEIVFVVELNNMKVGTPAVLLAAMTDMEVASIASAITVR